jgi:hypothetical protein
LQELALRALPAASWCFIHRIFATRSGFFVDVDIFLLSRKAAPTEIRLLIENEKRQTGIVKPGSRSLAEGGICDRTALMGFA